MYLEHMPKMNIVNPRLAADIVSTKVFLSNWIKCMIKNVLNGVIFFAVLQLKLVKYSPEHNIYMCIMKVLIDNVSSWLDWLN